jgi:hypothetical protein
MLKKPSFVVAVSKNIEIEGSARSADQQKGSDGVFTAL